MELINFILMRIMPRQTQPYLDPSVVTYIIQVVIGVVITVGSIVFIYWRKAKQKISEKFGIDEEVIKGVEGDVIFYSTEDNKDTIDD